jgi:isochorismate synthase
MGATPEILFKLGDEHAETMALAGTKPAGDAKWTEKEIKEQQIVTDYIEELLFKNNITEYSKTGLTTVEAGNVVHLKTGFNISIEQLKGKIGDVLKAIHPTPAVCGLPREKAYKIIRKVEKHDRQFYAGFLGPWKVNDQSQLFVNLRCAEITKKSLHVFAGGGLTSDSTPEQEWEETIHKSETLLSVVENL